MSLNFISIMPTIYPYSLLQLILGPKSLYSRSLASLSDMFCNIKFWLVKVESSLLTCFTAKHRKDDKQTKANGCEEPQRDFGVKVISYKRE